MSAPAEPLVAELRRAKRSARTRSRTHTEPLLVAQSLGPLAWHEVIEALPRQAALAAPAKLALRRPMGLALSSEIPRLDDAERARELAAVALDAAEAWLSGESIALASGSASPDWSAQVEAALAEIPWQWRRAQDRYRVHAAIAQSQARLWVEALPDGATRVRTETTLPRRTASARALALYCIEVNGRLRLARMSAASRGAASALVWEGIAPAGLALDLALPLLVEAVAVAHAETRRAVSALCNERVAKVFLGQRKSATGPAPRNSGVSRNQN